MKIQFSKNLIAIGMVASLLPLHVASAQSGTGAPIPVTPTPAPVQDEPVPTVPPSGTVGPKAVDLQKTGAGSRTDLSIPEIVAGAMDYTTLAAALEAAGLMDQLKADGPFTLLAPDNDAFAALPEGVLAMLMKPGNVEMLRKLLTYHIIPKRVTTAELNPGKYTSSEGSELTVVGHAEGKPTIQGSGFGITDVMAKNGVIHVVKAVLIPPTVNIQGYKPVKAAD